MKGTPLTRTSATRAALAAALALVAALPAAAGAAAPATINPSSATLPTGILGAAYAGQSFTTNCGALTGAWSIAGAPAGPGTTTATGTSASINTGVVTATDAVKNYSVTVTFTPSGSNTTCTNQAVTATYALPVVKQYAASAFGGANTQPTGVLASGTTAYVAEQNGGTGNLGAVYSIANATTNPPTAAPAAMTGFANLNGPAALVMNTTTNALYVANYFATANQVSTSSGANADFGTGCVNPSGIGVTNDNAYAITGCAGNGRFYVTPTAGGASTAVAIAGSAPSGVVGVPDTNGQGSRNFFVADALQNKLYSYQVSATTPPSATLLATATLDPNCVPANIAVPPVAKYNPSFTLYVACPGSHTVDQIVSGSNGGSFNTPTSINVGTTGSHPFGVALEPSSLSQLVVTESGDDQVRVLNTATPTSQTVVNVGSTPAGVSVFPSANGAALAYVADMADGSVYAVDPPTAHKRAKAARHHRKRHHRKARRARAASAGADVAVLGARATTTPLQPPPNR
jgi:hypothetical protein